MNMNRINELFQKVNVINVGIEFFKDDIIKQGAAATHLDWKPPGGGKPEIIAALDTLSRPAMADKIEKANREAVERIIRSHPVLVGFGQAIDVVRG